MEYKIGIDKLKHECYTAIVNIKQKAGNKMSKSTKEKKNINVTKYIAPLAWKAAGYAGLAIILGLAVKGASQYLAHMDDQQKIGVASVLVVAISLVVLTGLNKKLK